jgi:hypothetical protein
MNTLADMIFFKFLLFTFFSLGCGILSFSQMLSSVMAEAKNWRIYSSMSMNEDRQSEFVCNFRFVELKFQNFEPILCNVISLCQVKN